MGVFDVARGAVLCRKAYKTYTEAIELGRSDKPDEAKTKYHSALEQYAESVALGYKVANSMLSYALLLMREGEFEKAREIMLELNKTPKLPDDSRFQLRVNYSVYLWKTGKLDEAIATIRRAADMKLNGTVYSMLGMYLVDKARETGEFEEARAFNDSALEYDDEDGEVLDNVARLYELMSEAAKGRGETEQAAEYRKKAREYYIRAHKASPRQITTIYYLARMCWQDGDIESAKKLLSGVETLYYTAINPIQKEKMLELKREIGA